MDSGLPQITRDGLVYLWHAAYYDGPLSGACEWKGKRYWFSCVKEELRPNGHVDEYGDPDYDYIRVFHLLDLSLEEWAYRDSRHELFRKYVGTHTDYDRATQRRAIGAVHTPSEARKFYDAYPTGSEPIFPEPTPVAWYEA